MIKKQQNDDSSQLLSIPVLSFFSTLLYKRHLSAGIDSNQFDTYRCYSCNLLLLFITSCIVQFVSLVSIVNFKIYWLLFIIWLTETNKSWKCAERFCHIFAEKNHLFIFVGGSFGNTFFISADKLACLKNWEFTGD